MAWFRKYFDPLEASLPQFVGNFYENQCRVLELYLRLTEDMERANLCSSENVNPPFQPWSALPEILRVAKVGESLIKSCENEHCLRAFLRQGERALAFAETLEDIDWCLSVRDFYRKECRLSGNPSLMAKDEFPYKVMRAYKELHMLQHAALADQRSLHHVLTEFGRHHVCSIEECGAVSGTYHGYDGCIFVQIKDWILNTRDGFNADRVGDMSEVDHTSVLWNVNSGALENGRFIGVGGFCSVHETKWLGDTYARKTFQMHSPEVFKDEANALAKLRHRHIVAVSAFSLDSRTGSLLLERMPYDLRHYMDYRQKELRKSPPFSNDAAVDLMLQVAEAMRYMHSQNMVHRDLKPENILVDPIMDPDDLFTMGIYPGDFPTKVILDISQKGFVVAKLTDFGLAKVKREVTNYSHLTKNQGTRRWMAPEVFGADADNDEHLPVAYPFKTDVYSFGIVCSEILTGMAPFPDVQLRKLYSLITDARNPLRPELPESCPKSLATLIQECWHTDPVRRPPFTEICMMLRYIKALLMSAGNGRREDADVRHWLDLPYLDHMRGCNILKPGGSKGTGISAVHSALCQAFPRPPPSPPKLQALPANNQAQEHRWGALRVGSRRGGSSILHGVRHLLCFGVLFLCNCYCSPRFSCHHSLTLHQVQLCGCQSRYTLPTWAEFELGHSPVYWDTANGRPPTSGQLLTIYFNPSASELTPNSEYGIGFNGFNQPIMCGGEHRAMTNKERGSLCAPIYAIKVKVPLHTLTLEFSFTDGQNWDGPYKLAMELPEKLKGLPQSYFDEGLAKELAHEGACENAIYPEAVFVQDRCAFPAGIIQKGGDRIELDIVPRCTDLESPFFDPLANVDNGSCPYVSDGEH